MMDTGICRNKKMYNQKVAQKWQRERMTQKVIKRKLQERKRRKKDMAIGYRSPHSEILCLRRPMRCLSITRRSRRRCDRQEVSGAPGASRQG